MLMNTHCVTNMNAEGERKQEYIAIGIDFLEGSSVDVCVTLRLK
jgi:hypothetical protein